MIVDILPNQYEALAAKHSFRPWQTGLLGNMLSEKLVSSDRCINVNMGSFAGHTYFARVAASSEFPFRTKVYLTRQEAFSEYSSLLFDEDKSHEPIELLDECKGYVGDYVSFILVDMSGESPRRFKDDLSRILSTASPDTRVVILQADFSVF